MPETPIDSPSKARNSLKTPTATPSGPKSGEATSSSSADSGRVRGEIPNRAGEAKRFGKGSGFVGKASRSGPPKGNANNMRHGLKAGKLPPDAKYIEIRLNIVRRNLEQAVIDAKGAISLPDAAAIQTCIRWERHAALAQRWLTKQYGELKPEQRLTFSREIARASGERDKAIVALQLGEKVNRPWLIIADNSASDLEDK